MPAFSIKDEIMIQTTIKLHSSELNENLLIALQKLFADKTIRIDVTEMDDTEYLNSSPANRDHLLRVMQEIEAGESLVSVDMDDYS